MKLDNKGWSLNTLLICMAVLFSFLLISIFNIYKFASTVKETSNNNTQTIADTTNNYQQNTNTTNNISNNQSSAETPNEEDEDDSTSDANTKYYQNKESQFQAATIRYLKENDITVDEEEKTIVWINDLVNKKYLPAIKDEKTNNTCSAYAVCKYKKNDYDVTTYIKCDSYTTTDYGVAK